MFAPSLGDLLLSSLIPAHCKVTKNSVVLCKLTKIDGNGLLARRLDWFTVMIKWI